MQMSPTSEQEIAKRFGLAQIQYQSAGHVEIAQSLVKSDALVGLQDGLSLLCKSLQVSEERLGTCWRAQSTWPQEPILKVKLWQLRKVNEEGNYAPACGTINLFGTLSSLFHEMGHAIDFQHGRNASPWSHSTDWISALDDVPEFCGQRIEKLKSHGRVKMSDIYLATPHEFFARAFECFVVERDGARWSHKPDCSCPKTYPQGWEREHLCAVIERHVMTRLSGP